MRYLKLKYMYHSDTKVDIVKIAKAPLILFMPHKLCTKNKKCNTLMGFEPLIILMIDFAVCRSTN